MMKYIIGLMLNSSLEFYEMHSMKHTLLKKVEIPTEFRDGIMFVSNRDGIGDGKKH